jgi:hypothetical protein
LALNLAIRCLCFAFLSSSFPSASIRPQVKWYRENATEFFFIWLASERFNKKLTYTSYLQFVPWRHFRHKKRSLVSHIFVSNFSAKTGRMTVKLAQIIDRTKMHRSRESVAWSRTTPILRLV